MEKSERKSLRGTVTTLRSSRGAVIINEDGSYAYGCLWWDILSLSNEKWISCREDTYYRTIINYVACIWWWWTGILYQPIRFTWLSRWSFRYLFNTFKSIFSVYGCIINCWIDIWYHGLDQLITHWETGKSWQLHKLALIYNKVPLADIHQMIILCSCVNVLFQCIYYVFGITGAWRKSYKILNWFSNLSILGMFL